MRTFTFTTNTSAKQKVWKNKITFDRKAFEEMFTSFREDENKDGLCYIPGELIGTERKGTAIRSIDMLVYDVDGKQTLEQIDECIEKAGVYALVYSTHSHLTTKTAINVDHYYSWARKAGVVERLPSQEDMEAYLKHVKKDHLQITKFDGNKIEQTSEGQFFIVHHEPVPKFRVMLPLNKPIVLAELAVGSKGSEAAYKSIYHGVGQALGLDYDHACAEQARLYYFPSCKPGAEKVLWQFQWDREEPVLLDWEAYPRVVVQTKATRIRADQKEPLPSDALIVNDKNGVPINLKKWISKNYEFDIEELLQQCLPDDMIKAERKGGGFHVTCPFEHEHTTTGGLGTFCVNSDGDLPWTIHCMHASCTSNDRDRLDYLAEYIRQGYVLAEDLGIEVAPKAPEPQPVASKEEAAAGLGIKPEHLVPAGDDEVDEIVFGSVENEEDDKRTSEQVYSECLQALRDARNRNDIKDAFGRMIHKKCVVEPSVIVEMMAQSVVSGSACVAAIRGFFTNKVESPAALLGEFHSHRETARPLSEWIANVYSDLRSGHELKSFYRAAADFYGYTPRQVLDEYTDYQQNLILQERGNIEALYYPEFRERYAKLKLGSHLVFLDRQASREKVAPIFYTKAAMSTLYQNKNRQIPMGKKTATIYICDEWMKGDKQIAEYNDIVYLPRGAHRVAREDEFNIWNEDNGNYGFAIPPIQGDCSLIIDHIKNIWCNGDAKLYNWVLTWLAHIVQFPGRKPHSAIALMGPPGTGKSIIFEFGLSRILGEMYGASGSREDIVGRWSGHLANKLLWLSEETLFAGDHKAMQQLKDRITRSTIDIEKKGVDKFSMDSYTRYVFTSNELHALHLDHDDRRFCVLDTNTAMQKNVEHFTKMREYLEGKGANHLLYFLLNWEPEEVGLSWGDLNTPPFTSKKAAQIDSSRPIEEEFFVTLLRDGCLSDVDDGIFTDKKLSWPLDETENNKEDFYVKRNRFRRCFDDYVRFMSSQTLSFKRSKFNSLFEKYIGCHPNDLEKTVRIPNGPVFYAMKLPTRREAIMHCIKTKCLTIQDLHRAEQAPDSHLIDQSML